MRVELAATNAADRIRIERSALHDLSRLARTEQECQHIDRIIKSLIRDFEAVRELNLLREEDLAGRQSAVGRVIARITPEEPYGSDAVCLVSDQDYAKHWRKQA